MGQDGRLFHGGPTGSRNIKETRVVSLSAGTWISFFLTGADVQEKIHELGTVSEEGYVPPFVLVDVHLSG
jgi:hypothetical protein